MNYKLEEIREHFSDFVAEQHSDWLVDNADDLHHYAFNESYYLVGRWKATEWLGEETFNVLQFIAEYEKDNFGEISTDLTEPEHVVNMYVYILGERVVADWVGGQI